ncbi:PepSY-like domain-containing protein [Phocaeicola sp.]
MKKNWMLFLIFAASAMLTFSGCSDDDNTPEGTHLVSKEVQNAFNEKFPQAYNVEWELKGNYAVVDFDWNGSEHSSWFDPTSATWFMTETDLRYTDLPQAVKTTHEAGEYATWAVDDVDMLTREGMETLYVVEVEKGETDVDLYYSPAGILVKTVVDAGDGQDYEGYLPQPDAQSITAIINEKYPNARIIEIDREKGMTEVEILDGNVCRDVYFNGENEWVKTTWDVRYAELPEAVKQAAKTKYPEYVIDDADYVSAPSGEWYELDLENERTDHEIDDVKINADGSWL